MAGTSEQELIELEKQYWRAVQDKDIDTIMRLTDDECIVAGAGGVSVLDKQQLTGMIENARYTLDHFDLSDTQVRRIGDDVAIVAYKVREEVTVDGEVLALEAADTSTWVNKSGRWLCALHSESLFGDPFGRDRRRDN